MAGEANEAAENGVVNVEDGKQGEQEAKSKSGSLDESMQVTKVVERRTAVSQSSRTLSCGVLWEGGDGLQQLHRTGLGGVFELGLSCDDPDHPTFTLRQDIARKKVANFRRQSTVNQLEPAGQAQLSREVAAEQATVRVRRGSMIDLLVETEKPSLPTEEKAGETAVSPARDASGWEPSDPVEREIILLTVGSKGSSPITPMSQHSPCSPFEKGSPSPFGDAAAGTLSHQEQHVEAGAGNAHAHTPTHHSGQGQHRRDSSGENEGGHSRGEHGRRERGNSSQGESINSTTTSNASFTPKSGHHESTKIQEFGITKSKKELSIEEEKRHKTDKNTALGLPLGHPSSASSEEAKTASQPVESKKA